MIPTRLIVYAIGVASLLAAILLGLHRVYDAGYRAAEAVAAQQIAEIRAAAEADRADQAQRVAQANARAATIEADAGRRIAAAQAAGRNHLQTTERALREHPDFAAVERPDDLDRVRDDQLRAVEDAASRAADLSGAILRGVRPPDSRGEEAGVK